MSIEILSLGWLGLRERIFPVPELILELFRVFEHTKQELQTF